MSEPLDVEAFEAKMTIAEKYAGLINGELVGRGVCLLDRELTEMVTARIDEALQEHSSAEVERLQRERERSIQICLNEYRRWKDAEPDSHGIAIGAIGAISNILCAIEGIPTTAEQPIHASESQSDS